VTRGNRFIKAINREIVAKLHTVQQSELRKFLELRSKELQKIGCGIPFKVEELGTSPRRLKGTFMSLEYTKGWISLKTRQRNEKRKNH